jgi:hypothetical protein
MSEPAPTLPYGAGPPPEGGGSDLVRFIAFMVAAAIVLVSVFLLIRAQQAANSGDTYEACLAREEARTNPPGFRPEDFCQRPD